MDSGASYSMMDLREARSIGLDTRLAQPEVDLSLTTAAGGRTLCVRPGRIRCWWSASLQGYPFDWPILYRVNTSPDVPPVLGLGGVVKTCRWTFDGTPSPNFPYGFLALEDIR